MEKKQTKTSKFKCFENETNLKKSERIACSLGTLHGSAAPRLATKHDTWDTGIGTGNFGEGDMREEWSRRRRRTPKRRVNCIATREVLSDCKKSKH